MFHAHTPRPGLGRLLVAWAVLWTPTLGGAEVFPILLGDQAALRADFGAEFRYDDNLFLTAEQPEADLVAVAVPGLLLDYGKTGPTQVRVDARMQFIRHLENSQEDDSLLVLSVTGRREAAHTQWALDGSHAQIRANSRGFQNTTRLVRYDTTQLRLSASHALSARMTFDGAVTLNERSFATPGFSSSRDISVPVSVHRAWTPRIGGGLQYRFRHSDYDRRGADDLIEHTFGVGTRGDFTSTLSGRAGAGIGLRQRSGGSSENLRLDVSLDWRPDARTLCSLSVSRDTEPSNETATSYESFNIQLQASRELSPRLAGQVLVTQQWADYSWREDTLSMASASLQWMYSEAIRVSGAFTRESNRSSEGSNTYTRNVLSCSASYRF